MIWEDSRRKAFRYFPILDVLAVLAVGVVGFVGSIFDETMTYGFPVFLIVLSVIYCGLQH